MSARDCQTIEPISRRRMLGIAAGGLGGLVFGGALPEHAVRAQSGSAPIRSSELRSGLIQLSGDGGNVLFLNDTDGVVLVDSGAPEDAGALAAQITERASGAPIDVLFNTHWHLAHTGGNERLAGSATRIVAHENTRLWMSTEYYVDWQERTYTPRPAAALPTETFYSTDPQPKLIELATDRLEYGHLREAHTDGDIYVFFRDRNVLAAGGVVTVGAYPVLDHATGGWIGGLMDATRKLLELSDDDTLIVPARGPAQSREHLAAQLEMVATVRGRVEDLMRQGRSAEEMLAAGITREFDADWGTNRGRFISNVYDGLWWQGRLNGSL